jgi:glycerol-3-phosphate O-acyltransferase/dihydroxyacetone phosphate acyltransferase
MLKEKYNVSNNNNATLSSPKKQPTQQLQLGALPLDLQEMQAKLEQYQSTLEHWGLRDYQLVRDKLQFSYSKLLYIFLHGAFVLSLASIPSLFLNAPVGFAAHYWSEKEAQKDLKASRVKLAARDVLLSKKIVFSIVAVPLLWVLYALILLRFSSLEKKTILVLFLSCPVFSYIGVMAVEAGIVDIKDLWPAFLRLLPSFRNQSVELPKLRSTLQKEVRALIRKYGPELGAIYYEKTSAWETTVKKTRINNSFLKNSTSEKNLLMLEKNKNLNSLSIEIDEDCANKINDKNDFVVVDEASLDNKKNI